MDAFRWLMRFQAVFQGVGMVTMTLSLIACSDPKPIPAKPGFAEHMGPVFERYCVECHGIEATESNFDMRTLESILAGGDSGPAVVPGKPEESLLLEQMEDEIMPPEGVMPMQGDIDLVRQWIAAGAQP